MAKNFRYKHIFSVIKDKTPSDLLEGEIAVNNFNDFERLFIKNSNNRIVPFISEHEIVEKFNSLKKRIENIKDFLQLYDNEYLTFTALENTTFKFSGSTTANTLSYSLDDGRTWTVLANNTETPTIPIGSSIMFKGTCVSQNNSGIGTFISTGNFEVEGNTMSLLYGDNFSNKISLDGKDYVFLDLFKDTNVVSAKKMVLPATKLAEGCYDSMFQGCSSLTTAPVLPAFTLTNSCYYEMFSGCTSLNYIKCLATDISAVSATTNWVNNVASAGTFVKAEGMTDWLINSSHGIPVNWTVENVKIDYSQEYLTFKVLTDGTIGWKTYGTFGSKTIQYSINGGEWTDLTSPATAGQSVYITGLTTGDLVRVKGNNTRYATTNLDYTGFEGGTATYDVYGNIMSLTDGDNFKDVTDFPVTFIFCSLFKLSNIVSAENLILPATTLTECCYRAMFAKTSLLTKAPKLPATNLALQCYWYMFEESSISEAPELPAATLVQGAYGNMFINCHNLNYIKCLATDISASACTVNWVSGVSETGTFVKDANMTSWTIGVRGIPRGWVVYDGDVLADPEIACDGENITLTCETEGAEIYYKLNHSGNYVVYTTPISISADTFIEAYSKKENNQSNTVSQTCIYIPHEYKFAELKISNGPLYYGEDGYEIKDSWNYDSYNSVYGKNTGSTYFSYIEMGDLFETSGFTSSDGNIRNDIQPLEGWRLPTSTEWQSILGTTRDGSTVNGLANKHYAIIQLTGVTHAGNTTPLGLLVFPDGETITGVTLSNMDNTTYNTGITEAQLNTYLNQGCIFLPTSSFRSNEGWGSNTLGVYCSSHEESGNIAYNLYFDSDEISCVHTDNKSTVYSSVRLVKDTTYDDELPFLASIKSIDSWQHSGKTISTPYSVNAIDGHSSSYAKGNFNFETTINLHKVQPTYLWFQHADQSADIYVDNTKVETHWGGYNAFFTDITNYVHTGTNNIKVVLCNTTRSSLAPCSGDFNFNATLGNVKVLNSPILPDMLYGYDGFHVTSTISAATSSATITVRTSIPVGAEVVCSIDDDTYHFTDVKDSTGNEISFTAIIENPHLWNGTLDPHLYTITLGIYRNGELYHKFQRDYGLRYYQYVFNDTNVLPNNDPYTGFLLNGSPYLLRGVCMHHDIEGKANALSANDIANDFNLIEELGCNFIRLAHYPHPKEVYDHCDRLGIIVQTEVPCVNNLRSDQPADYYTRLEGQYRDMVNQHYNHPCILFWGLSNETSTDDKDFAKTKIEGYTSLIKSLDSERWVGYVVSNSVTNPSSYFNDPNVDWFGANIYVGWYSNQTSTNPTSQINTRVTNIITNLQKPLAYSEYGAGGTQHCHSDDPNTTTTKGNYERHDIEYQMMLHEGHIAAIRNFPQLLFTSEWQLFDIAVTSRNEGYTICLDGETTSIDDNLRRLNDKGIVERDHVTKKDTFYLYKAEWSSQNFVHICGKDYTKKSNRVIKCYSNDGTSFKLYVNDNLVETVSASNNIITFTARNFKGGDVVRVEGNATNDTFTFDKDASQQYLTFVALEDGTFKFSGSTTANTLSYSLDNGTTWTALAHNTNTPTVTSGSSIMWKGTPTSNSNGIGKFISSGTFNVKGNAMSILYGDNFSGQTSLEDKSSCFFELFKENTNVKEIKDLILPATTLANYCYKNMFLNCSGIIGAAPELPATALTTECYRSMFNGCTGLTVAPELPATTLANSCYYFMFQSTAISIAPELPATDLQPYCYACMFAYTNITEAPELPATTLANYCYTAMFNGCTGLTSAPELPATSLQNRCYENMFMNCSNLNYIKCLATTNVTTANTNSWTNGVAASGTFVKATEMTGWTTGVNGIPVNWIVENDEPVPPSSGSELTFEITSNGTICWKLSGSSNARTIEYCKNGGAWTSITATSDGTTFSVASGDTVRFRGNNANYATSLNNYCTFCGTTCEFNLKGNIMSLISSTNFETATTLTASFTFTRLFAYCGIKTVDKDLLPATTLQPHCYENLFQQCHQLSLAPELPATVMVAECYRGLFDMCISLKTAPELPATTLANNCYRGLFYNCSGLTDTPVLAATVLTTECYRNMFYGCKKVNYIKCLATTNVTTGNTNGWTNGVAASGTFVKAPGVSWTRGINGIPTSWIVEEDTVDYSKQYLTFIPIQDSIFRFSGSTTANTLSYSLDSGATWTALANNTSTPTVTSGSSIMFKGECIPQTNKGIGKFSSTGSFDIEGNTMSLLYGDNFSGETSLTGKDYALTSLFSGNTNIVSAENMILPATTLSNYCYQGMFQGCTGLTSTPELPATTLTQYCYDSMFSSCRSLTSSSVPELPATTLASYCYRLMFWGCAGLTTAPELPATDLSNAGGCYYQMFSFCTGLTSTPELPATTLAASCYGSMFYGCTSLTSASTSIGNSATTISYSACTSMFRNCTSLTTAPELPATTLSDYCYHSMFSGCTSLTTAPELPATTLVSSCYREMFRGCTSLNYIKCLATSIPSILCTLDWVNNVASAGTFVKAEGMTGWTIDSPNGIPTNWTVDEDKPDYSLQYLTFEALEDGTFKFSGTTASNTLSYSLDSGATWTALANNTNTPTVTSGSSIMFKGACTPQTNRGIGKFSSSGNFDAKGNVMSLLYRDNFSGQTSLNGKSWAFCRLFSGSNIINSKNAVLPATTLAEACYYSMFWSCTSLVTAPELPATTLTYGCYHDMFSGCTSLTTAPELPATILAGTCYCQMFDGCTSLTTAPELPATNLAQSCYQNMFKGCTSLTIAPELPATTLESECYQAMFYDCTGLTTAPSILPATTVRASSYYCMFNGCTSLTTGPSSIGNSATTMAISACTGMFGGCTSLTTAPELPATTLSEICYQNMFYGCTSLTTGPSSIGNSATTMAASACSYMFQGCTGLTTAPEIPATTLGNLCYYQMFSGCTSLTTAPSILPATTLAPYCYVCMFYCCTGLTTAPELPATTLADGCYGSMFYRCSSLTIAPELPAPILVNGCYSQMFRYCSNLNYIKCLAKTNVTTANTGNWVANVAYSGTFYRAEGVSWTSGVNGIPTNWVIEEDNYSKQYLTFIALEDGTFKFSGSTTANTLSYSLDSGETWVALAHDTNTPTVTSGSSIMFKGTPTPQTNAGIGKFISSGRFNVESNALSLLYGDNFSGQTSIESKDYAFYNLFSGNTNVVSAEKMILSATTLSVGCYEYMFYGCTGLTSAPELPATTLASSCYMGMFHNCTSLVSVPINYLPAINFVYATSVASGCYQIMFEGCTSLTTAPELPATTLVNFCYMGMFRGCTSLTQAPVLPATTLASSCYKNMFQGCTSLTTAPELPATTLVDSCYANMFTGCTSLTQAPELLATTLVNRCYENMFYNCSNLNYIKCLATNILVQNCTDGWLNSVAASGTFIKDADMTSWGRGTSGIPLGWTIKEDFSKHYLTFIALEDGTFKFSGSTTANTLSYSLDSGATWTELAHNTNTPTVTSGSSIMFKGTCTPSAGIGKFISSGRFDVEGSTMSLLYGDNFSGQTSLEGKNYTFYELFTNNTHIVNAKNMAFPATTLADYCYAYMFKGCTSLTIAPELPATILTDHCYYQMFSYCTSLTTAPSTLPATTLANYCYYSMFQGCTGLTTAPSTLPATTLTNYCYYCMFYGCTSLTTVPSNYLPATTLTQSCYSSMFYGCSSLTVAPELPATILENGCYNYMFKNCTSLTTAPELPATILVNGCYNCMFSGCTNINYIKCLATDISATNCTYNWVIGVQTNSGTFVKNPSMSSWTTGTSGIPTNWTVEDAS